MSSPDPWQLVGWRGGYPSPPAPFVEAYFCIHCGDYFSHAVAPSSQPQAPDVEVVATLDEPPGPMEVRCEQCGTAYPQYGVVTGTGAATPRPEAQELLRIGFPPGASPALKVTVGKHRVERFVLVLAGPLPPLDALGQFAASTAETMIERFMGTAVRGGRVPLHVLAVDELSVETPWVSALLDTHVYRGTLGARDVAIVGPAEGESGTRMLLCGVAPARLGR